VAVGVCALKNATQFSATVFASPVRPAGTPEDDPPADELADAEAAGAEVAGADVAGAELLAGADDAAAEDELDELLLQAAAVSVRQATPAAHATTDCHLDRRITIRKWSSPFVGVLLGSRVRRTRFSF
jgi:hypothetical protein